MMEVEIRMMQVETMGEKNITYEKEMYINI